MEDYKNDESIDTDSTKQAQRAFLRERFLRLLGFLQNSPAAITMHDKTSVTGLMGAVDVDFSMIQVSNLSTPMGVIPRALLRSSDIINITFEMEHNENSTS